MHGIMKSKWTGAVLFQLDGRTVRFNELRLSIDGISQKMLAMVLKRLEACGMVVRRAYPVIPPRVEYSLTERGARAADALRLFEHAARWTAPASSAWGAPGEQPSRPVRATTTMGIQNASA